jgi:voltage-gated potassium channel
MSEQLNPTVPTASAVPVPDPDGALRRRDEIGINLWDIAVLLATVVVAVAVPIEVVFGPYDAGWPAAVSVLISLVFTADIVMRFSRTITVGGIPIIDPMEIRRRYLRSWFTVDVLAAIPFEVLALIPGIADTSTGQALRILGLLRVLRVARVQLLQREWRVRASFNPALLRLAFFFFWIVMVAHWIACGWIALNGTVSANPALHPYHEALYWSITTLTTVGYGDLVPERAGEVAYAMVVMALGAAMYGYIIGNVASLIANIDVERSRHLGRMETVNNFMRDRKVPRDLQARVRDYHNYLWESRMGSQSEMFDDLPTPLRIEIALHLNRTVLRKVPLFEGASEAFLRELVLNFEPTVSIPGEAIVRRGEIGHRIYFINKGRVEVLAPDESQVVATLSDGNFFGEMALLTSRPRSNTVRALDYCNLYTLDREKFDEVLENFPDFAADVRRIADDRIAETAEQD